MLADTFPGSDPGEVWAYDTFTGATAAEVGGEAVITLPSGNASSAYGAFRTNRFYDLRGDAVSVKVTNATNTATTASAFFSVGIDGKDYIQISQRHGTIEFSQDVGGTWTSRKTVPYSPVNHLYWRFREDGTNTYWETSPDGATWQIQTQVASATLFPLQYVEIELGGTTDGGEVNPGSAHFADLNGGTPTGKWCPAASITDDFSSSTRSTQWYRSWVNSPETVAQVNGQLVFTLAPNTDAYAAYLSSASYDLTGSAVVIQVPTSANPATSAQTNLFLDGPASTSILMEEEKGQLYLSIETASGTQDVGSVLYDPVQHAWWRIRESGGALFWETAPDGKAWAVQAQLSPLPFPVDVLDVDIQCGTYKAEASPGTSVLDNLNLPPP